MSYRREFTAHWPSLLGASVAMALGSALNHYLLSVFGPALIADLGWTKADFALIGALPMLTMVLIPVAGRFVDRFGARVSAIVGFTATTLGYLALAAMPGPIAIFFAIYLLQQVFGILTTTMVFCRVVVERFDLARGIALSLVMTAPPLVGGIAAPLMDRLIDDEGWRAGYLAVAALSAFGGVVGVVLIGRGGQRLAGAGARRERLSWADLRAILRNPTLLLLLGGMFLVNVPQVFASSQLKLVVMDSGVSDSLATWMVSIYAAGVIAGRFASGLALDRVPAHLVAIAALGLPAIGYCILASHVTLTAWLVIAVMLIGLAQGAEADIGAYLISRRFPLGDFSLMMSLMTMMIGLGGAAGSLVLSAGLRQIESYVPFLLLSAAATLAGAALFALTGRRPHPSEATT